MATGDTNVRADIPEIERDEHNSPASAKDVVLWGYDTDTLAYVKVAVDSTGAVKLA